MLMKFEIPFARTGRQQYFVEGDARILSCPLSPIRIAFNLRQPEIPPETKDYVTSLVEYARERIQMALSVQPIVGNLIVPQNCSSNLLDGIHAGESSAASPVNQCYGVDIPRTPRCRDDPRSCTSNDQAGNNRPLTLPPGASSPPSPPSYRPTVHPPWRAPLLPRRPSSSAGGSRVFRLPGRAGRGAG